MTAVIADVDGKGRGGHLVDLARAPARVDELTSIDTLVGQDRVIYQSITSGSDPATGSAWVQVTGRMVSQPAVEVVTRYDAAPEVRGVVIHTSLKLPARPLAGGIAIGDRVTFAQNVKAIGSPVDLAGFGESTGYAVEPLAEPPFVVQSGQGSGTAIGLPPEMVAVDEPEVPFIYSRVVALLDRPDAVALASARATVAGQPLGEVELELAVMPRKPGNVVAGGRYLFKRAGSEEPPLELPIASSLHPGDRKTALLPAGKYAVDFEGSGHRSRRATQVTVAPRVLSPIRVDVYAGTGTDPDSGTGTGTGTGTDAGAGAGTGSDAGAAASDALP